jgi:hypothetical protein
MKTITILGRRWFERHNGNTYHSAAAYVDGELIGKVGFEYGYGEQWQWTGFRILIEKKIAKLRPSEKYPQGGHISLWHWCEKRGVKLILDVADVSRRRDL